MNLTLSAVCLSCRICRTTYGSPASSCSLARSRRPLTMADSPTTTGFTPSFDPSQSGPSFRHRDSATASNRRESSIFGSPTSTMSSGPTRFPLRTNPSSTYGTPTRKRLVIRSDPTLATCFNPADKELYDLWAPK